MAWRLGFEAQNGAALLDISKSPMCPLSKAKFDVFGFLDFDNLPDSTSRFNPERLSEKPAADFIVACSPSRPKVSGKVVRVDSDIA